MDPLRIIFFGTPKFAVPSLQALIDAAPKLCKVVAVVAALDKPKGRGQKLTSSPIKDLANKYAIPVFQPSNLKSPEFLSCLHDYKADLQVIVAFRILPQVVFGMPSRGTFNLHASLLPAYRGAAPIHWAVMNGETITGLTTFFLEQSVDTGQILLQEKTPILSEDTAGTLYDRMSHQGAQLVLKTVQGIFSGTCVPIPQVDELASNRKFAPKIQPEDCVIDWGRSSTELVNFIRGLSPNPGARGQIGNLACKVLSAKEVFIHGKEAHPGELDTNRKSYLHMATGDGYLSILTLQVPGKRVMTTQEFLCGCGKRSKIFEAPSYNISLG